ncbi:hypothetical protein A2U01_0104075, partial [Trifolium medium]|nr:hypothetical protein [Trifolium medium]
VPGRATKSRTTLLPGSSAAFTAFFSILKAHSGTPTAPKNVLRASGE